jgi:hypothetical protein
MFSDDQIPPPTAIRSVNQVMSIPFLCERETVTVCSLGVGGIFVLGPTQIATRS